MRKFLFHVAIDSEGHICAMHNPTPDGKNPLVAPDGGSLKSMPAEELESLKAGKLERQNRSIPASQRPSLQARPTGGSVKERLSKLRRQKMWQISKASHESRDRVFDDFPHVPMRDQHKHIDVMLRFMRGKLKETDLVLVRNLKSGNYENVSVGALLDEIDKSFALRQELRKFDQSHRDQVNNIRFDAELSDDAKIDALEKFVIPEFLGVARQSNDKDVYIIPGVVSAEVVKSVAKNPAID